MKPTPPGWPRISTVLYYEDPGSAIDWLVRAFGFVVRECIKGEDGSVVHSELTFGDGLVMVSGVAKDKVEKFPFRRSPTQLEGINTQNLFVYVDDAAAHLERARAAGAVITSELAVVGYGEGYWSDRGYACRDLGGHHWWFYERLRNPKA